jgi:hypothetical protein
MDSSKRADERGSHEESEDETQDYFRDRSLSEVMDCSKRPDERGSHEESEAETQDYFTDNFNSYFYNFVKVGVRFYAKIFTNYFPKLI